MKNLRTNVRTIYLLLKMSEPVCRSLVSQFGIEKRLGGRSESSVKEF